MFWKAPVRDNLGLPVCMCEKRCVKLPSRATLSLEAPQRSLSDGRSTEVCVCRERTQDAFVQEDGSMNYERFFNVPARPAHLH